MCDSCVISRQHRDFAADVAKELQSARQNHGPLQSLHEGFAVLLEEVDEFKAEVWKKARDRDPTRSYEELVQIAAMARRIAEDVL